MAGQLLLGPFTRTRGFVNVGALLLIAEKKTLVRHDLHEFQDGAVLCRSTPADEFVDLPDGGCASVPQHRQNLQFGIGWSGRIDFGQHLVKPY